MKLRRKRRRTTRAPRPDDVHAREMERLRLENERLRQQVDEQAKQIDDLKRQLALRQQNSTMTWKPPSSDGLAGQAADLEICYTI
jgi:predicted RNase H-like nuclease (RuvC/YqgF family)